MIAFPTRTEFRWWLGCQKPDAVVGRTGTTDACPLARCLRALGATDVDVAAGHWQTASVRGRPPCWAAAFIGALEWDDVAEEPRPPRVITAAEALRVLDEVTE